jgi:hypothetical protein
MEDQIKTRHVDDGNDDVIISVNGQKLVGKGMEDCNRCSDYLGGPQ